MYVCVICIIVARSWNEAIRLQLVSLSGSRILFQWRPVCAQTEQTWVHPAEEKQYRYCRWVWLVSSRAHNSVRCVYSHWCHCCPVIGPCHISPWTCTAKLKLNLFLTSELSTSESAKHSCWRSKIFYYWWHFGKPMYVYEIPHCTIVLHSPSDIIGSIVNVCPGFMTPTASFSARRQKQWRE